MANAEYNPLENLPDLPDTLEELITLSTDPKKIVAKKATSAYVQATIAMAAVVPLLTVGGPTSISQAPVRKPDMEQTVPSSEGHVTLEGESLFEVETSNDGHFLRDGSSDYPLLRWPKNKSEST